MSAVGLDPVAHGQQGWTSGAIHRFRRRRADIGISILKPFERRCLALSRGAQPVLE